MISNFAFYLLKVFFVNWTFFAFNQWRLVLSYRLIGRLILTGCRFHLLEEISNNAFYQVYSFNGGGHIRGHLNFQFVFLNKMERVLLQSFCWFRHKRWRVQIRLAALSFLASYWPLKLWNLYITEPANNSIFFQTHQNLK